MRLKTSFNLLKEVYEGWDKHKISRLAAALAYYTIFSLAPLLILVIAIAGAVIGGDVARSQLIAQLQQLVGADGAAVIDTVITVASKPNQSTSIIASAIGILILVFGAVGVFVQLQDALNTIWEVAPKPEKNIQRFIFHRFLSFGMVLGIAFLLLVSLAISAALAFVNDFIGGLAPEMGFVLSIINLAISFSVITLLFTLIFKYLPDVKIAWSDVIIGAVITALLFTAGKYLIGLYLGRSTFSSAYGAAGSLVVLLVWIYYSAQIIFLGAEFTQVYARHFGSRIRPVDYAIFVTEDARAQEGIVSKEIFEQEEKNTESRKKSKQPS